MAPANYANVLIPPTLTQHKESVYPVKSHARPAYRPLLPHAPHATPADPWSLVPVPACLFITTAISQHVYHATTLVNPAMALPCPIVLYAAPQTTETQRCLQGNVYAMLATMTTQQMRNASCAVISVQLVRTPRHVLHAIVPSLEILIRPCAHALRATSRIVRFHVKNVLTIVLHAQQLHYAKHVLRIVSVTL